MASNISCFIIFPNQLYENVAVIKTFIKNSKSAKLKPQVSIVLDTLYFYDKDRDYNINKVKLAYLAACSKWYHDWLQTKLTKSISCEFIDYKGSRQFCETIKAFSSIEMYDPTDHLVLTKYMNLVGRKLKVHNSPNFIMTREELNLFSREHGQKNYQQSSFFKMVKNKIKFLQNVPSSDKYNREKFPRGFDGPEVPIRQSWSSKKTEYYYNFGHEFVEREFAKNIGSTFALRMYPITHTDAKIAFLEFTKNRLKLFGRFQDAIKMPDADVLNRAAEKIDPVLFHSGISAPLNMGLLCPIDLIEEIKSIRPTDTDLENSIEAYTRQIAGWREYMRFLYTHVWSKHTNVYKKSVRLTEWSKWQQGKTGIDPLDLEIKKALLFGYSHHIVRLMVFLNIFILLQIDPRDIVRWFSEVVSIDAFDWVMISNIYMMGCFVGTKAMRRPYISSSNYIIKMSDYKRGQWTTKWDNLYHSFVKNNQDVPGLSYYR